MDWTKSVRQLTFSDTCHLQQSSWLAPPRTMGIWSNVSLAKETYIRPHAFAYTTQPLGWGVFNETPSLGWGDFIETPSHHPWLIIMLIRKVLEAMRFMLKYCAAMHSRETVFLEGLTCTSLHESSSLLEWLDAESTSGRSAVDISLSESLSWNAWGCNSPMSAQTMGRVGWRQQWNDFICDRRFNSCNIPPVQHRSHFLFTYSVITHNLLANSHNMLALGSDRWGACLRQWQVSGLL